MRLTYRGVRAEVRQALGTTVARATMWAVAQKVLLVRLEEM